MRSMLTVPLAAVATIGIAFASPAMAAITNAGGSGQNPSAGAVTNGNSTQASGRSGNGNDAAARQAVGIRNSQCLRDVRAFQTKMQKDGYWLNGYRDMGYGFFPPQPAVATGGAAHNNGSGTTKRGSGPWGNGGLTGRPGFDLRTLIAAAVILGRHGNEQSCENVLHSAQNIYHGYTAELARHGVNAPGVTKWREAQMAKAKPVTQLRQDFRLGNIKGTQVRSPADHVLGSVNDVVLNPHSGKVAYLLVSFGGGAFGIGSSTTAVPWRDFYATPGLNTLVLKTTEQALNHAPKVNPNQFGAGPGSSKIDQQVGAYWRSHLGGGNRAKG